MKRIVGIAVLVIIAAVQLQAQMVQDLFKQKFPQLGTQLTMQADAKLDKGQIAQYRDLYAKLRTATEDIEKQKLELATETNVTVFNLKELKDMAKAGQLAEMEKLILARHHDMKVYMKDKTMYGVDSIECIENLSVLKTLTDQKDFNAAYKPYKTLFVYYPISSTNVYSKGEDILEFKMKEAHNKAAEESKKGDKANNDIIKAHLQTKRMWFDTLMMLYDQRIVYFGDAKKYGKGYIKGKMGQAYYSNYKKEAFDTAYMYMKESVQLEMEEAGHVVILNYFVSGIDMLRAKKITPNDIVEDYLLADKAISKKIADAEAYVAKYPDKKDTPQLRDKAIPSYKEVSDKITETFTKCPCSSCEVLDSIFNSKYEENKANVEWLKKATGLLEKKGCKESSFFEKGAIDLYNIEPSALAAYQIAKLKLKKEQYAEAAKYYEEAINLEVDPLTKSKYLYESAIVARAQDQYSKARTSALKAAELRPNWGEPYLLIAKMYAASAGSCGSDAFEQQGTYWAAVDKAQYAKNIDSSEDVQKEASSLISQYASRYPTKEQGFMREKYEGGSFTVGCWINEATTIRFIK